MKITFLLPVDDLGGGNRVVATYATQLLARGHDVLAVINAPARPSVRERWRAWRHGYWHALRERRLSLPGHVGQSGVPFKVLERHRPIVADDLPDADFVVATWWETARWMHELPGSKGRKVHLIQGYETWGGNDPNQVNASLRLPNRKIAISSGLKTQIETTLGPLGIEVVSNGVDLHQFQAPRRRRGAPPRVGFIYARDPIKGTDRCLQALALARQRLPGLQALAFGTDTVAGELGLAGIRYHPRPAQDRLASLYASCDAWLFGSRIDSFGLPVLEAMACRTPVIGVPVGAAPDLLANGAGMLLSASHPNLPEAMADAIVSLCTVPSSTWQAMSDQAHERASACTWHTATDRLLQLLEAPDRSHTERKVIPS